MIMELTGAIYSSVPTNELELLTGSATKNGGGTGLFFLLFPGGLDGLITCRIRRIFLSQLDFHGIAYTDCTKVLPVACMM